MFLERLPEIPDGNFTLVLVDTGEGAAAVIDCQMRSGRSGDKVDRTDKKEHQDHAELRQEPGGSARGVTGP